MKEATDEQTLKEGGHCVHWENIPSRGHSECESLRQEYAYSLRGIMRRSVLGLGSRRRGRRRGWT